MSDILQTYVVSSNIGGSFRTGLNQVVLDRGTALYRAADVEPLISELAALRAELEQVTQERDALRTKLSERA